MSDNYHIHILKSEYVELQDENSALLKRAEAAEGLLCKLIKEWDDAPYGTITARLVLQAPGFDLALKAARAHLAQVKHE